MHTCEFCKKPILDKGIQYAQLSYCDIDCNEGAILKRIEERHRAWKAEYDKRKPIEVPHYIDPEELCTFATHAIS